MCHGWEKRGHVKKNCAILKGLEKEKTTVVEPTVAESVEEEPTIADEASTIREQTAVEETSKESILSKARRKMRKKNNGADDKNVLTTK